MAAGSGARPAPAGEATRRQRRSRSAGITGAVPDRVSTECLTAPQKSASIRHQAGSVRKDSGMPTPTISVRSGGSRS